MKLKTQYVSTRNLTYSHDAKEGFARNSVVDIGSEAGPEETPSFSVTIDCANIAGIGLSDVRFTNSGNAAGARWKACRQKQRVNQDGLDAYLLRMKLPPSPSHSGRSSCRLYDLDKEFSVNLTPGRFASVIIPKHLLPIDLGALHLNPMSTLSTGLLSEYIRQLVNNISRIPIKESAALCDAIVSMTTSSLSYASSVLNCRTNESGDTLLYKARRFILDNVSVKTVTVDSTCQAMGVSRATLYRAFESQSIGLSEYIKLHRYRRVLRSLASSGGQGSSRVVEIVERCGFTYNSMFVSNFKQYFGITPVRARDFAFTDSPLSGLAVGGANGILHAF